MFIKTLMVEDYYNKETAKRLAMVAQSLPFVETELGKEIQNFNHIADDADEMFSKILGFKVEVDQERSGIFTKPVTHIHFKPFETARDWVYVVVLEKTMFNIYEHESGAQSALQNHRLNFRNMFEWDYVVNYYLSPGQGAFFRPWLFHSFDGGIIQTFRLRECLPTQDSTDSKS